MLRNMIVLIMHYFFTRPDWVPQIGNVQIANAHLHSLPICLLLVYRDLSQAVSKPFSEHLY